ncbi:MAG: hypothetical protein ACKVP7_26900 [Hyphomicrobiaceae bacterium]
MAVANGWRRDDPTLRMKRYVKGELDTWAVKGIATVEWHWPMGMMERLTLELRFFTGRRLSSDKQHRGQHRPCRADRGVV